MERKQTIEDALEDMGWGGGASIFNGYPTLALGFDTVQQTRDCSSAYWLSNSSMNLLSQKTRKSVNFHTVMNIVECLTANTDAKKPVPESPRARPKTEKNQAPTA